MSKVLFEFVSMHDRELLTENEMKKKYTITGYKFNTSQREELQGSPRIEGFYGAMFGGYDDNDNLILRYETREYYLTND